MTVVEHVLLRAAALGATLSGSLAIYLVCLRFLAWDLVPAASLPHIRWWQRHARPFLVVALTVTVFALVALVILRGMR
jgi:hypothetical protein